LSHEFQILANTGESTLYYDKKLESVDPQSINPEELMSFYAAVDDQHDKKNCPIPNDELKISKGIEVGHIFYFGTKYSEKLKANIQNKEGKSTPVHMGSYGIGVSRLVGAIIEAKYNDKEEIMKWPISVSPYDIAIIPLINKNDSTNLDKAVSICKALNEKNLDVIIDDTEENFSSKLKKFNLIGIPYQILIGKKSEGDLLEFKEIGKESQNLSVKQIIDLVTKIKNKI